MLIFIFCILSIIIALVNSKTNDNNNINKVKKASELTAYNITSNYNDWDNDLAIMFYAPW